MVFRNKLYLMEGGGGTNCGFKCFFLHTTGRAPVLFFNRPTRIIIACTSLYIPRTCPVEVWLNRTRWRDATQPSRRRPRSQLEGAVTSSWADVAVVVCGWRSAWTQQVGMVSRSRLLTDAPTEKQRATSTTSQTGSRRSANGLPGRQWHLHLYCLQSTLLHHTEGEVRSGRQVAICHENTVVCCLFWTLPVLDIVVRTPTGLIRGTPLLLLWGQVTIYTKTLPSLPLPTILFCWSIRAILDRYQLEPGGARETSQGTRGVGASVPYGSNNYCTQH